MSGRELNEEEKYVKEEVEKARKLCQLVLEKPKGQAIVRAEAVRLKQRRRACNAALKKLPKKERHLKKLKNTFEIYDVDGSNYIDFEEFKSMLDDLHISGIKNLEEVFHAHCTAHERKEMSFEDFKAWYDEKGKDKSTPSLASWVRKRKNVMTGNIDQIRAKNALVAEALKKASSEAKVGFRDNWRKAHDGKEWEDSEEYKAWKEKVTTAGEDAEERSWGSWGSSWMVGIVEEHHRESEGEAGIPQTPKVAKVAADKAEDELDAGLGDDAANLTTSQLAADLRDEDFTAEQAEDLALTAEDADKYIEEEVPLEMSEDVTVPPEMIAFLKANLREDFLQGLGLPPASE